MSGTVDGDARARRALGVEGALLLEIDGDAFGVCGRGDRVVVDSPSLGALRRLRRSMGGGEKAVVRLLQGVDVGVEARVRGLLVGRLWGGRARIRPLGVALAMVRGTLARRGNASTHA